ncbi:unnamed protein product, partial [Scytosiphon promiscuus]
SRNTTITGSTITPIRTRSISSITTSSVSSGRNATRKTMVASSISNTRRRTISSNSGSISISSSKGSPGVVEASVDPIVAALPTTGTPSTSARRRVASFPGTQYPPMRFGGGSDAIASPPRPLPGSDRKKQRRQTVGGASAVDATIPAATSPARNIMDGSAPAPATIHTVSAAKARQFSAAAAAADAARVSTAGSPGARRLLSFVAESAVVAGGGVTTTSDVREAASGVVAAATDVRPSPPPASHRSPLVPRCANR